MVYHGDPKFSNSQVWANNADPDQGPHCLAVRLHLLEALIYAKKHLQILGYIQQFFSGDNVFGLLQYK